MKIFNSKNGSLGFIGSMSSPICSFFTSYLQQRRAIPIVGDMITQNNLLKRAKRFGTTVKYALPNSKELPASILMFSDAARPSNRGPLGYIRGLLLGDVANGSTFHVVS